MPDNGAAELCPLVSREQIDTAFHRALNMFIGRGKRHSAAEVAKGAGVHRRCLDCYRGYPIGHPDHRPLDEGQRWSIASFVGADLTTEVIRLIGQAAYDLPDIEPDPGVLAADSCDDTATVTRAAVDGAFDRNERQGLSVVGSRMMHRGAQLVALGSRAA